MLIVGTSTAVQANRWFQYMQFETNAKIQLQLHWFDICWFANILGLVKDFLAAFLCIKGP